MNTALFISINTIGIVLYYSPITLRGYWVDAVLIVGISIFTLAFRKKIGNTVINVSLGSIATLNILAVCWVSVSFFHGIVPVHSIPEKFSPHETRHAYFIERGDQGILNGCYGEIQYHQTLDWAPFLEIKVETETCSQMDYRTLIEELEIFYGVGKK